MANDIWDRYISIPMISLRVNRIREMYIYDGEVTLTLFFAGQKKYDYVGDSISTPCRIGWKLIDADGYVIETGTCYTSALETGERFRNCDEVIYSLKPGEYSLKLMDVR